MMNKTLKFSFTLLLFALLGGTQFLMAQLKIGYTNTDLILYQLQEVETIQKELQKFAEMSQAEIQIKNDELQKKLADYQEKQAVYTDVTRRTKEEELMTLDQNLQQLRNSKEQEYVNKEGELLQPVLKRIQDALEAIAKQKDLDFVFQTNVGNAPILLYAKDTTFDITQDVLALLKGDTDSTTETADN